MCAGLVLVWQDWSELCEEDMKIEGFRLWMFLRISLAAFIANDRRGKSSSMMEGYVANKALTWSWGIMSVYSPNLRELDGKTNI